MINFENRFSNYSYDQLITILANAGAYKANAVASAPTILRDRNIADDVIQRDVDAAWESQQAGALHAQEPLSKQWKIVVLILTWSALFVGNHPSGIWNLPYPHFLDVVLWGVPLCYFLPFAGLMLFWQAQGRQQVQSDVGVCVGVGVVVWNLILWAFS
jgi:hypothetical protein